MRSAFFQAGLATTLALLSTGCINNFFKSGALPASTSSTGIPSANGSGGAVLSRVQKDTFDPAGTLDLLGDGSHTFGQMCTPKQAAAAPGATTCTCSYSYIRPDGTQVGPVEVDTSYSEQDQIRCPYNTIPGNVPYIKIHIHMTNTDTVTNEVTYRFTGTGISMDLTNPTSFSQIQRYQCRDIVTIPYLWDGSVYDPILSEDSRYSYPLNFYTTNMGKTLALYAGGDASAGVVAPTGWNCPAIPNDTSAGMDLTIFSVTADSSGSKAIFPPSGSFDRSTFFVSKTQSGVFTVPVNAVTLPGNIYTTTQAPPLPGKAAVISGIPPLGFAARPTPIANNGGESCPDASVAIPAGFHWAKLWLFRKALPRRTYPFSNILSQLGQISCNPKPWTFPPPQGTPNDTFFTDCSGEANISNPGSSPSGLAARVFESTAMCMKPTPGGATDPAAPNANWSPPAHRAPGIYANVDFTPYATGTDILAPARHSPDYGCGMPSAQDPAHVCNSATGNVAYDSGIPGQGLIGGAVDSRFDYLFVVSPTSVMFSDMKPESSTSTHSIYTPLRFLSPNDCKSSDPDVPTGPGDCSPSRMLTYQLKTHEVGSPGDPGQDDPNRPGDFPMCVLQPN